MGAPSVQRIEEEDARASRQVVISGTMGAEARAGDADAWFEKGGPVEELLATVRRLSA